MKKIIKFNDGEIDVSFQKDVTVHADPKSNKTWLEIPGLPADYKGSKKVRVTPPPLLQILNTILLLPMTTKEIQFLRWYKEL